MKNKQTNKQTNKQQQQQQKTTVEVYSNTITINTIADLNHVVFPVSQVQRQTPLMFQYNYCNYLCRSHPYFWCIRCHMHTNSCPQCCYRRRDLHTGCSDIRRRHQCTWHLASQAYSCTCRSRGHTTLCFQRCTCTVTHSFCRRCLEDTLSRQQKIVVSKLHGSEF